MTTSGEEDGSPLAPCCIDSAERAFSVRFPLADPPHRDLLRNYLLKTLRKWGRLTGHIADIAHFRSVPDLRFINAMTFPIECAEGHRVELVILGSRAYYLAWRISMICATYWDQEEAVGDGKSSLFRANDGLWPQPVHVNQLRKAMQVYTEDYFLSNEGFEDLRRFAMVLTKAAATTQQLIAEFGLLFLVLHEIQHFVRMDQWICGYAVRSVADIAGLSEVRAKQWSEELSHDANSARFLWLSAAQLFGSAETAETEQADAQAAGLAFAGADLALHALQLLEEGRYGVVSIDDAKYAREFVHHPPCKYRRDALSLVAYSTVTRRDHSDLFKGHTTPSWKMVSGNIASEMRIRDRLFAAYQSRQE